MISTVRTNNLCLNCFRPGHLSKECTSHNRCKKCQKPHHTLLHIDFQTKDAGPGEVPHENSATAVCSSNTQANPDSSVLLMTCQVTIYSPDGAQATVRGILDSGSTTSFVSQRVVQSLGLRQATKDLVITGIAGISHSSPLHSVSSFKISPTFATSENIPVTAIVVPKVTCSLPLQPVTLNSRWNHLSNLTLSDPEFGRPGKIDILLGIDLCAEHILQGRRQGPSGPMAFETTFGWVLAGKTDNHTSLKKQIITCHSSVQLASSDDILRKFWEIEDSSGPDSKLSPQERVVMDHFLKHHTRSSKGAFTVPLPRNPSVKPLGESRQQAVRRFQALERSLNSKNQFRQFAAVMQEYVDLGHAELVPVADLHKAPKNVFYMPMHAVYKEHSTTTKVRAVFDASAKSSSGTSLNDTLLVGPTVHPSLIEVLLRFRLNKIALTADVSKMYRAIELTRPDRDLHRFVWRNQPDQPLADYRMTRVTFGVSASALAEEYTKTLGIEWNTRLDCFRLAISKPPNLEDLTKRALVSDIAKTFDILGWFAPATVKVKILLQKVWEEKVDWDDQVPPHIKETWAKWRAELPKLSTKHIPRSYFGVSLQDTSVQIHGFADASESAYAAVVYLRLTDQAGCHHVSLVMAKTKVAPIKRLLIPRLELCGANLLAQLLQHTKQVFGFPMTSIHAWTDGTVVLNWLDGNPKRFKTYVGNRISAILDLMPPEVWRHVSGLQNPADCASRGLYPSELLEHSLWWNGPEWLLQNQSEWPQAVNIPPNTKEQESKEIVLHARMAETNPVIPIEKFSSYNQLKRITAWILRFIRKCQAKQQPEKLLGHLSTLEVQQAENHWLKCIQSDHFPNEVKELMEEHPVSSGSPLACLNPLIDGNGLIRVGGRRQLAHTSYESRHPIVIHGKHKLTHLLIQSEHHRLLHAGPTLLAASLGRRYHIISGSKTIRSICRKCVTCRKFSTKPRPQLSGQLPIERITPGIVFEKVGVDYAGPVLIKYGHVRKPVLIKAYIGVFVSLSVKAVHLELITDLTSESFIASLKRFVARRGLPTLIWSDNGTNFVGAARQLKELYQFLQSESTQGSISAYLSTQGIEWKFIPQRAPNFGGLWEAAVKCTKTHLKKVLGEVKLTYEEMSTLLYQVEASLNSRPLAPLSNDDDGIEALTPGHFLIGQPLRALPDAAINTDTRPSLLKRWQLCNLLTRQFWKRWSSEYLTRMDRLNKWRRPTRNLQVGDLVVIKEDSPLLNDWPLAKVTHPGQDQLVRVATIKTHNGIYKRPANKLALLLPIDEQ